MNQKRSRNSLKLVIAIVGVFGITALGCLAVKIAYDNGVKDGESQQLQNIQDDLSALGSAIEEKTKTLSALNDLNSEAPSEIDSDNITTYREKLDEIITKVNNSTVKSTLKEYAETWKNLAETYASENNSAIKSALENLRSKASDTAIKITEVYNSVINSAAEKLPDSNEK